MNPQSPAMILKPGREKSLIRRHPWVFSGAVKQIVGDPENGSVIPVFTNENQFLAKVAYSHNSQIIGRVWTFDEVQRIDRVFIRGRLDQAFAQRKTLKLENATNAYRLVHAESDGIPGLIVDRYADDVLVVQFLSYGVEVLRDEITEILLAISGTKAVYERSDAEVRLLEGLQESTGLLGGSDFTDPVVIEEHGLKYFVPIKSGHKTGYYLDQRANRKLLRGFANGNDVLDCFSYSGGFAINALAAGARSVTAVDDSAAALELFQRNRELNRLPSSNIEVIQADVFKQLRKFRDQNRKFDTIVLDPPKFAPTRAHAKKASRGYKDINLLAFKLLRPGGILFTFSCSGGIDSDLFQKIVAGAALDADVEARILYKLSQDADHPVSLNFPEGEYLKGLVCQVN